ncbi:MAG: zf-HC2 domain-containing protein [Pyrinomonadaceae bacterium]
MREHEQNKVTCDEFEEYLSDYIENALPSGLRAVLSEHAMVCPLCHSLLNDVKQAVQVCHELEAPDSQMAGLEAKILTATMPESAMDCDEFEEYLTDYLDGFLPAVLFHRWERHALLCDSCSNLPGAVVRSLAACYTFKVEELEIPAGLNAKILEATLGTSEASSLKAPTAARFAEWIRGLRFPVSAPQLAPVAMMLLMVFLVFLQSGNQSIGGIYQKGFELAGETYRKGADAVLGGGQEESGPRPTANQGNGGQ